MRNPRLPRQKPPLLGTEARTSTGQEVALGFTEDQVRIEVLRCLAGIQMHRTWHR
jgi:hypothetical protein